MTHQPIKVGITGCGKRIHAVLKHLLTAAPKDTIEVVALYDPVEAGAQTIKEESAPSAKVCSSHEELLSTPGLDWVLIGSWNCYHADQVIAALEAGKHVFCEKPLATTPEDCIRLQEAKAKAPNQHFFFGLVLRYTALYQKVKEAVESGVLGQLISFEFNETLNFNHGGYIHGNWRRHREYAGTHLLEKCCHDFDLVNWLLGSLPVKAASFGGKDFFHPRNRPFADSLGANKEGKAAYQIWPDPAPVDPFSEGATIVDNQVAILEYANGTRATFHTSCNAAIHERRMYLLGATGTLRADAVAGTVELCRIGFEEKPEILMKAEDNTGHYGGDEQMGEYLAKTILEGQAPLADLEDGVRSAVSCFGVDTALDQGIIYNYAPLWEKVGVRL